MSKRVKLFGGFLMSKYRLNKYADCWKNLGYSVDIIPLKPSYFLGRGTYKFLPQVPNPIREDDIVHTLSSGCFEANYHFGNFEGCKLLICESPTIPTNDLVGDLSKLLSKNKFVNSITSPFLSTCIDLACGTNEKDRYITAFGNLEKQNNINIVLASDEGVMKPSVDIFQKYSKLDLNNVINGTHCGLYKSSDYIDKLKYFCENI